MRPSIPVRQDREARLRLSAFTVLTPFGRAKGAPAVFRVDREPASPFGNGASPDHRGPWAQRGGTRFAGSTCMVAPPSITAHETRPVQIILEDFALTGDPVIPEGAVGLALFAHGSGSS